MNQWKSNRVNLSNADLLLLLASIVTAFVVFGVHLFHYDMGVDEELGFSRNALVWFSQDRPSVALLNWLFVPTHHVTTDVFFGLVFFVASVTILVRNLFKLAGWEKILIAVMILSSPIFLTIAEFKQNFVSFNVGLFACTVSLWLVTDFKEEYWKLIFGVLALVFAIGCYQSFVLYFIAIYITRSLLDVSDSGKKLVTRGLFGALVLLLSIAVYIGYVAIPLIILDLDRQYIDGFRGLQLVKHFDLYFPRLQRNITDAYMGNFGVTTGLLVLSLGVLWARFVSNFIADKTLTLDQLAYYILASFMLLTLPIIPFAINLLGSGVLPLRSLFVVAFVPASFITYLFFMMNHNWARLLVLILAVVLCITNFTTAGAFNRSYLLNIDHDRYLSELVAMNIVQNPAFRASETYDITFYGEVPIRFKSKRRFPSTTTERSLFNWGVNENRSPSYRIFHMMDNMGKMPPNIKGAIREPFSAVPAEVGDVEGFPSKDFVVVHDKRVLVFWQSTDELLKAP